MKTIFKQIAKITTLFIGISILISCQPDDNPTNNGLAIAADALNPSFVIDQSNAATNTFKFIGNNTNVLADIWDLGDGNNPKNGGNSYSAFIPDAGTYVIQHKVVGRGGASKTESQTLVVPTSNIAAGNLVQGGKFLNATDHAKWTILNIFGSHVNLMSVKISKLPLSVQILPKDYSVKKIRSASKFESTISASISLA